MSNLSTTSKESFLSRILSTLSEFGNKITPVKPNDVLQVATKFFFIGVSLAILVWLSIFFYVSLYYNFIPSASHVRDVHLQYSPMCSQIQKSNLHDKEVPYPSANVTLSKTGYNKLLLSGQPYRIYIRLEMPESKVNQDMGMFSVTLNLIDGRKKVMSSSTKSAMIRYRSPLLHVIYTLFFSSFFLAGISEEKQKFTISMHDNFEDDPNYPSVVANLVFMTCDIQIYSVDLHIEAEFGGLRYFMYYWPLSSAFIGIGMGQFFLFMVAFLSWYRFLWPDQKKALLKSLKSKHSENNESESILDEPEGSISSRSSSPSMLSTPTFSIVTADAEIEEFEDANADVQIEEINSTSR